MTKTEKILLNHGIRPTQMRLKIYKFLKRKQSAVSFSDLKKAFVQKSETNKTANRTTFYRNLKIFEDSELTVTSRLIIPRQSPDMESLSTR